jgi:hypothetical protein
MELSFPVVITREPEEVSSTSALEDIPYLADYCPAE